MSAEGSTFTQILRRPSVDCHDGHTLPMKRTVCRRLPRRPGVTIIPTIFNLFKHTVECCSKTSGLIW